MARVLRIRPQLRPLVCTDIFDTAGMTEDEVLAAHERLRMNALKEMNAMPLCDNENLRLQIKEKVEEIAHAMPGGVSQEMLDRLLDLETLIAQAFVPDDDPSF